MSGHRRFLVSLFLIFSIAMTTAGCLSLGGKTYVTENADTTKKINSLENRISVLEQALGRPSPVPVPGNPAVEPVPSF